MNETRCYSRFYICPWRPEPATQTVRLRAHDRKYGLICFDNRLEGVRLSVEVTATMGSHRTFVACVPVYKGPAVHPSMAIDSAYPSASFPQNFIRSPFEARTPIRFNISLSLVQTRPKPFNNISHHGPISSELSLAVGQHFASGRPCGSGLSATAETCTPGVCLSAT